jgi:IrrE N-terminal-like domain
MTLSICRVCGHRATLRSDFESFFCPECGEEDTLEPEDAYDPEPTDLVCAVCRHRVDARAAGDELVSAPRLTPEDPCPRCGRLALAPLELASVRVSAQREIAVSPEYGMARGAAERVLERHWTGETPVDVYKIAEAMGLTVVTRRTSHQGRLSDEEIQVPDDEARVARRFVVAHEIGHHELRHQVPEEKIEAEANAFASELLMPRPRLKRAVEAGLSFDELRRLFDVSSQALTYALDGARLINKVAGSST